MQCLWREIQVTVYIEDQYDDNPNLYTEIAPRLWQGGTHEDDFIESSKFFSPATQIQPFTAVLTLNSRTQPVGWGVKELRFGFTDGPIEKSDVPRILEVSDWAYQQWKGKENVLVRCQAGANRSGLVVALVLMKDGASAEKAIELIQSKRSFALSNSAFVSWLKEI
jgi:hypothetical protein